MVVKLGGREMTVRKTDRRFRTGYILRTILFLVPPLISLLCLWRGWNERDAISWLAVAFFVVWIGAWIAVDALVLRAHRCPNCGRRIGRPLGRDIRPGDPIRHHCPNCGVEWDTGLREAGE